MPPQRRARVEAAPTELAAGRTDRVRGRVLFKLRGAREGALTQAAGEGLKFGVRGCVVFEVVLESKGAAAKRADMRTLWLPWCKLVRKTIGPWIFEHFFRRHLWLAYLLYN